MDFQQLIDDFTSVSCVLSVEKLPDGSCGKIRIVCGNKAYVDSLKTGHETGSKMFSHELIPNSEYENYFPKDLIFEDYCYRGAILKQPIHTYVHPEFFDAWFNIFILPLASDREDVGYCLYSMDLSTERNARIMANLSQETAADVLSTCIKLRGTDDFVSTVNDVVADIRRICEARHVCLLLVDYASRSCSMLAQAYADTARRVSMNHWQDEEHFNLVVTWASILGGDSCLIVKNEEDMASIKEKNPGWYESLHHASVDSIVLFPLKVGGNLLGYIWATNFEIKNTVRIKETLELTTFFLASEISNYQLLNRLHRLSTIDVLTGVFNRNAMNNRVDGMGSGADSDECSIGVVFADLNGLKRINDRDGHQAGDLLLKNASMALQNAFVGDEIYRAGGDEFLVLLPGTTKDEMEKKIEKLRSISPSYGNVCFAVGSSYQEDRSNIRHALHEADEAMYADKEQFYREHPELKTRSL
ncbi:MAG: GGDEF domain-containing protein [Lachnospiraceae bacterium]|nr:GGDEF domain-containing protein [Lachnospiraceae bacterium]